MTAPAVERWFEFMNSGDAEVLDDLLAEDVRFYSPAVHRPKQGRAVVTGFLMAAEHLFAGTDFRYVAQWVQSDSAVLEFAVELDGMQIEGVDIVHWNADHRITSFKVMVRPLRGLQTVSTRMAETLEDMRPAGQPPAHGQ